MFSSESDNSVAQNNYKETSTSPFYKVVWPKESKHQSKIEVRLEDHPNKYEKKLYTPTLRQVKNGAFEDKPYKHYTCLLCKGHHAYITTSASLMEDHLEEHLNSSYTCKDCGANFSIFNELMQHLSKEHIYECKVCGVKVRSLSQMRNHMGEVHGHKTFDCCRCYEQFSSKKERKLHILNAHPDLFRKCKDCGLILWTSAHLHENSKACLRRRWGGLNRQCEICGKVMSENCLQKHKKRVHQKLRIYKCDICSYAGTSFKNLENHRMTHTGERPVKCELCDFSCIKSYQLKCHMRTHLKLKPYKCDKCSYASSWNVQVKDHMRAHFSPTRVDCRVCNITYKDQRGLNLHRRKEHCVEFSMKTTLSNSEKGVRRKRGQPTVTAQGEINKSKTQINKKRQQRSRRKKKMGEDETSEDNVEDILEEETCIPRKSKRKVIKRIDSEFEHDLDENELLELADLWEKNTSVNS